MQMKIGCCTNMAYYDALVCSGYNSISLPARDVVSWDQETLVQYAGKLADGPLERISLNNFCGPEIRLNGRDYDADALYTYMVKLSRRAQLLGFRYIGIGAPGSRSLRHGDDREIAWGQMKRSLSILCKVTEQYNVEVLLESVSSLECNFITTTREALKLIRELALPNLHLVYDIFHEAAEDQPLDVINEAAQEIRVVHIAQQINGKRAYLEEAHIPTYRKYWDALKAAGYSGEWNLEALEGDPQVGIPQSLRIMNQIEQETISVFCVNRKW